MHKKSENVFFLVSYGAEIPFFKNRGSIFLSIFVQKLSNGTSVAWPPFWEYSQPSTKLLNNLPFKRQIFIFFRSNRFVLFFRPSATGSEKSIVDKWMINLSSFLSLK